MEYRAPAAVSPVSVESRFFTKVYGWMAGGLVVTALLAYATLNTPALFQLVFGSKLVFFGLVLAELGLVAWLSGLVGRMSASTAAVVFVAYSALNGITLSAIFLVYARSSVVSAFSIAAATFGAMSVYGMVTKRTLDGLGSFAFVGLIGVLIAGVVNVFLKSPMMEFVICCAGIVVFLGLAAYDTRKLRAMASVVDVDGEDGRRMAVRGALALYLDFVNLFLMILRLLGNRR